MFEHDDEGYKVALVVQEESKEDRIARMKTRMLELKERREADRKLVVEHQLLRKWRNESDELRAIESKLNEKRVSAVRDIQVVELQAKKHQSKLEEEKYSKAYEQDRQLKIRREEADAARLKELNSQTVLMLEEQLVELQNRRIEEKRLLDEESRLSREKIALQVLEEKRALMIKDAAQRASRAELDKSNKARIARKAQEMKEAMEMDLDIVKEFFKADQQERQMKIQKREDMRKEMIEYRNHLEEMRSLNAQREKEIDKMYKQQEIDMWNTRSERWSKERQAKERLMEQVLIARREQLEESAAKVRQRQIQNAIETEELMKNIELAQYEEEQIRVKLHEKSALYNQQLVDQLSDIQERKRVEKEKKMHELAAEKELDEKFKNMLKVEKQRLLDQMK